MKHNSSLNTSTSPRPNTIAVFEGGGPKGLLHAGALSIIENHVQFEALAGTSAGAIIAGLVSVGVSGKDILDDNHDGQLSGYLAPDTKHFFDPGQWRRLVLLYILVLISAMVFRSRILRMSTAIIAVILVYLYSKPVLHAVANAPNGTYSHYWTAVAWIAVGAAIATMTYIAWPVISKRGFLATDKFESMYNTWLLSALRALNPANEYATNHVVSFADIKKATGRDLYIVTQRVHDRKAIVFSSNDPHTENQGVARCVMASMAIPIIFQPVRIQDQLYIDGGACSNFPVWTIAKHTQPLDPLQIVIGMRLGEDIPSPTRRFLHYIQAVLRALVYGDGRADTTGVYGLHVLTLIPPTNVSAYNLIISNADKRQMLSNSRKKALEFLPTVKQFRSRSSLHALCQEFHTELVSGAFKKCKDTRLCLYLPIEYDGRKVLAPTCHINFSATDCDDDMHLGLDALSSRTSSHVSQGECGLCWDNRCIVLSKRTSEQADSESEFTKQQWRLCKKPLACVLCIPIAAAVDWDNDSESVKGQQDMLGVLHVDARTTSTQTLEDFGKKLVDHQLYEQAQAFGNACQYLLTPPKT